MNFWTSMIISMALTALAYWAYVILLKYFGVSF
jgi:hypothetical protein